jgi:hypothetical protein
MEKLGPLWINFLVGLGGAMLGSGIQFTCKFFAVCPQVP